MTLVRSLLPLYSIHSLRVLQSNATFQRALTYYNQSDFTSFYELAQTLVGDTQFTCFDRYIANQTAMYGKAPYNFR